MADFLVTRGVGFRIRFLHNCGYVEEACSHVRLEGYPASKEHPAHVIGRVETTDDKSSSAIKAAIERFGITDPVQQEKAPPGAGLRGRWGRKG